MKNKSNTTYWFKRRRYGYGWVPTTWQGWMVIIVFLAIVISGAFSEGRSPKGAFTRETLAYLATVLLAVICLLVVARLKGPKPHWRWGKSKTDNPNEDF